VSESRDDTGTPTTVSVTSPISSRRVAMETQPQRIMLEVQARTVELNIDPTLTRPALKHLAVHECYPGHYVQFKLREAWYASGEAPADGLLSVVNTASSCTPRLTAS